MIKDVIINFSDGGYYHVRPDKIGDSIFGVQAHDIMFKMSRQNDYKELPMFQKIQFIIDNSKTVKSN